jgi:hypothetical protein
MILRFLVLFLSNRMRFLLGGFQKAYDAALSELNNRKTPFQALDVQGIFTEKSKND